MKERIAPNRKTGRMIAKNLIILLTLVIVTAVGMWAWFTNTTKVTAEGIDVQCKAPDGVEIAIVKHGDPAPADDQYSTSITLDSEHYEFISDLHMTEVTGDGLNANFLKPPLIQSGGMAMVDTSSDWGEAEATENADYLSFDLYFRSKSTQRISLTPQTSITPDSNTLTWSSGASTAGFNPSSYGDFSKDCLVGAVRFSVVSKDNSRQLLWIPAPNILLSDDASSVDTDLTEGDTYTHFYYDTSKTRQSLSGAAVVANNQKDYTLGNAGAQKQIVELTAKDSSDYYVNYVTCNIWIEGEDNESRLALVGGKYKANLEFMLME